MKFAHIENGVVIEVVAVNPFQIFAESYASTFIECGNDVISGYTYANGVFTAPPVPSAAVKLAEKKAARLLDINGWRAKANFSTFTHATKVIACDALSRSDIDAVAGSISLTGAFPVGFPNVWKAVDNTYLSIPDIAAFKSMYASMTAQGAINFARSQSLKTALDAAETIDEVEAIKW